MIDMIFEIAMSHPPYGNVLNLYVYETPEAKRNADVFEIMSMVKTPFAYEACGSDELLNPTISCNIQYIAFSSDDEEDGSLNTYMESFFINVNDAIPRKDTAPDKSA